MASGAAEGGGIGHAPTADDPATGGSGLLESCSGPLVLGESTLGWGCAILPLLMLMSN